MVLWLLPWTTRYELYAISLLTYKPNGTLWQAMISWTLTFCFRTFTAYGTLGAPYFNQVEVCTAFFSNVTAHFLSKSCVTSWPWPTDLTTDLQVICNIDNLLVYFKLFRVFHDVLCVEWNVKPYTLTLTCGWLAHMEHTNRQTDRVHCIMLPTRRKTA